jgi:hypothetical protein
MTKYAPTFPRSIWTVLKGKIAIHNHIEHHVGQKSGEGGVRVSVTQPSKPAIVPLSVCVNLKWMVHPAGIVRLLGRLTVGSGVFGASGTSK